jgi:FAD/FMN-containing dehydrogenase
VINASATNHPDLFWALRGGGGNFGVAASLEYRLHPLREVYGGLIAHPITAAKDALHFYRTFAASIPDDLTVFAALVHAPDGSGVPLVAYVICHVGTAKQAEADLRPLLEFGSPILKQVGPMPYPAVNMMLDGAFPKGALNYWRANFLRAIDDAAIDTLIDRFAKCLSPMSGIVLEHFHGAVTRVGLSDTAVTIRTPGFNLVLASVWMDPATTNANIAWTRGTYDAMAPHFSATRYSNYLADDEGDAVRAAYGPNYARLAQVKAKYDPKNLFRINPNVAPAVA